MVSRTSNTSLFWASQYICLSVSAVVSDKKKVKPLKFIETLHAMKTTSRKGIYPSLQQIYFYLSKYS